MRDVEAVLAAEREQEVVARDARDLLRLEAEQLSDAVVLVHDVVARAEVGERLQRTAAEAARARHTPTEDLVVGQENEVDVAPDETAARGRDGEEEARVGGELVVGLEDPRLDLAQHVLRAQRLAAMRERDDDALSGAHERRELRLRLGEPARGDRRPLRLERERLVVRERVELRRPLQRDRVELVLLPDAAHVVGLEDEVRRAVERCDEIVRHGPDLALVPVPVLHQVQPPLRRGIDRAGLDGVQRALRERRERANRLDLVAEELDAQRLPAGRREDVDDAAAHGELPAVVDALDALVAGDRERFREPLDADLASRAELERLRPRARRRQRLGQGAGRRADEAAAGKYRQSARSLADQMRRRLETGLPADAAARQEPDLLLAEEPGGRLGGVAGVGVLRQQADERALELLEERREHDGQRRLRHAGARRQRLGKLFEALQARDFADECVEYGTVHANGGTSRFRAWSWYWRPSVE